MSEDEIMLSNQDWWRTTAQHSPLKRIPILARCPAERIAALPENGSGRPVLDKKFAEEWFVAIVPVCYPQNSKWNDRVDRIDVSTLLKERPVFFYFEPFNLAVLGRRQETRGPHRNALLHAKWNHVEGAIAVVDQIIHAVVAKHSGIFKEPMDRRARQLVVELNRGIGSDVEIAVNFSATELFFAA